MAAEHRVAGHLDVYLTVPDELALIAEAGFPRPEIFWRDGMLTVYGGFKE